MTEHQNMQENQIHTHFRTAGKLLHASRCNNSHSGNLSIREASNKITITRTGAMLNNLQPQDLVTTSTTPTTEQRTHASSELDIHLKIYKITTHNAIAHGHALSAVAVAWLYESRIPLIDVEGAYYFGTIPVLEHTPATAHPSLGIALGNILNSDPVVILKGHGVFAVADTLEQAAQRITSVNDSAELIIKATQLGLDPQKLAEKPYLRFEN